MKILVSAGPTRENIDPVRFISNRSSGKMGYAIASASMNAGHETTLVSGPVAIPQPPGVQVFFVESAAQMACEIRRLAPCADIIIMAAAVSDYRPAEESRSDSKIKKKSERIVLTFEKTEDILAELGKNKKDGQILVGFAAETEDIIENALKKIKFKNLDWIIANDVSKKNIGFDSGINEVAMIYKDGQILHFPEMDKKLLGKEILSVIIARL